MRQTVAVDFDGVIHSSTSPWTDNGATPDPPVPGAIAWLSVILQEFDVAIYTPRGTSTIGRKAVIDYLREHGADLWDDTDARRGLEEITVVAAKPPALVYVDDRGWTFTGTNFPTVAQILAFKPWNKP